MVREDDEKDTIGPAGDVCNMLAVVYFVTHIEIPM